MFVCLYLCLSVWLLFVLRLIFTMYWQRWAVGGGREGGPRQGLVAIKNPRFTFFVFVAFVWSSPKVILFLCDRQQWTTGGREGRPGEGLMAIKIPTSSATWSPALFNSAFGTGFNPFDSIQKLSSSSPPCPLFNTSAPAFLNSIDGIVKDQKTRKVGLWNANN